MSKVRNYAAALGVLVALSLGSKAFAAQRQDTPVPHSRISRIATFIVKMLEDIRATFPGG